MVLESHAEEKRSGCSKQFQFYNKKFGKWAKNGELMLGNYWDKTSRIPKQ